MQLTIYATPDNGNGIPYVWQQMEVETLELDLPNNLFREDVVLSIVITDKHKLDLENIDK